MKLEKILKEVERIAGRLDGGYCSLDDSDLLVSIVRELVSDIELKNKLTENIQGYSKLVRLVGKLKQEKERLSEALAGIRCRHPQPVSKEMIAQSQGFKLMSTGTPYKDCGKCGPCQERAKRKK